MAKNIGPYALLGLAGFMIFFSLALSLNTMNISILGLDFTTMNQDNFSLWFFGFIILGFASLFVGISNAR